MYSFKFISSLKGTHTNSFPILSFITKPLSQPLGFPSTCSQLAVSVSTFVKPSGTIGLSYVDIFLILLYFSSAGISFSLSFAIFIKFLVTIPIITITSIINII